MFQQQERPFLSEFAELNLLRQDGSLVSASEAFHGKKYVLIYFSAHWCPPCQRFTPILADFYKDHSEAHSFEVLFVSSDRKESRMMDFFQNRSSNYIIRKKDANVPSRVSNGVGGVGGIAGGGLVNSDKDPLLSSTGKVRRGLDRTPIANGMGNWLALPFQETKVARSLARRFRVSAIPRLVVVSASTGCVITKEGKTMVYRDEHAEHFPWRFADEELARRRNGDMPWWGRVLLVVALLGAVMYYFYYYFFLP